MSSFWYWFWGDDYTLTSFVEEGHSPEPTWRANKDIKSVFPRVFKIDFPADGLDFNGAFVPEGRPNTEVCAMRGVLDWGDWDGFAVAAQSNAATLLEEDATASAVADSAPPSLSTLISLNPISTDASDPKRPVYYDEIQELILQDFNDIIVYHMTPELRENFVQSSEPQLLPGIKVIADDDSGNRDFYRTLELPFVGSRLSRAPDFDRHGQINGRRCDSLLRDLPADSDVYKRHMSKLYRFRFNHRFPSMQAFQDDQVNNHVPYRSTIDDVAAALKARLQPDADEAAAASSPEKEAAYQARIQDEEAKIDQLAQWAKSQKLAWAMKLLYYVEVYVKPLWEVRMLNGGSQMVTMEVKKWNCLMMQLEGDRSNPDGPTFVDTLALWINNFLAMSILPQMLDLESSSAELEELINAVLLEVKTTNEGSETQELNDLSLHASELLAHPFLVAFLTHEMGGFFKKVALTGYSWYAAMTEFAEAMPGAVAEQLPDANLSAFEIDGIIKT